jgi:hypothetical protein
MKKKYPLPNEHGVYKPQETIVFEKDNIKASVSLVEVGDHVWKVSVHVNLRNSGTGYAPNNTTKGFIQREEAFFDGLAQIKRYCNQHDEPDSIRLIIAWCNSFNQRRLF